ncbi:hypothetical protein RI138_09205 [Streptomyces sp. C11-1]|uniref:Uncharacterized protein n=1 Tax=Streptomyces durocortorensis TaxID=2811104 RepID=A0ABY9VTV5_9ACTN|nr:hypothetical protein [Streptomyces durocortorensis]WNF27000.1 hypothetical protein RI138_09205 [Streptomyces durocortorensis]
MALPLWVLVALIPEVVLTCSLLRWLPVKRERWMAAMPLPVTVVLALTLRLLAEVSWPTVLATCAGFLWGAVLALAPFRGWVSSWTLPLRGEARLRWPEAALVVVGVVTPLSGKRTDAALEKAFAVRQVVRARGPFPAALGMALLVLPTAAAVVAGWVTR